MEQIIGRQKEIKLLEEKMSGKPIIVECFYNFNLNNEEVANFHMLCEAGIIKNHTYIIVTGKNTF